MRILFLSIILFLVNDKEVVVLEEKTTLKVEDVTDFLDNSKDSGIFFLNTETTKYTEEWRP